MNVDTFNAIHLKITRILAGEENVPDPIYLTMSEMIEEYTKLLDQSSMYILGLLVQLMAAGKVRVEFTGYSERVELVHSEDRMSRPKAIAIVGSCLAFGPETDIEITQKLFLHNNQDSHTGESQVNHLTLEQGYATTPKQGSCESGKELSKQEKAILTSLVAGLYKKEIATCLNVSLHTVDTYVRRIYEKLNVRTRSEAVSAALRRKIVF